MLGGEPRFEHLPQPQRRVGVLGGIFGRLVDLDAIERHPGLAGLGHLVEVDGAVIEVTLRQRIEAVIGAAGIDHIGHQQRVVVGRDLDAAHGEDLKVEFQILADLEHAFVFEQRLDGVERGALGDLIGRDLALEQAAAAVAALPVRQRHVAGLVRSQRQREAAQRRLHRIEAGGLGVDGNKTLVAGALDPGLEPVEAAYRFIFGAVEFLAMRGIEPRGSKRLRRQLAVRGARSPSPACGGGWGGGRLARSSRRAPSGRALRVVLPRKRERSRTAAHRELRIRLDLGDVDAGKLGDAARQ